MVFFIKYLAVAEYPETEKTFYRVRDFQIIALIFFGKSSLLLFCLVSIHEEEVEVGLTCCSGVYQKMWRYLSNQNV